MQLSNQNNRVTYARRFDNAVLKCMYTGGKPTPKITWIYNGEKLKVNNNKKYSSDQNNILIIKNVTKSDAGLYTCVLSNSYHKDLSLNMTLNIIGSRFFNMYFLWAREDGMVS